MTTKATKKAASRPNLARKVTPKDEKTREDGLDQGVRIVIDGEVYEVRVGDMSAPIARDLRRNYGGSFNKLQEELASDPDIDSMAALVWLARRIKGDDVAFDDIQVNYESVLAEGFDISIAGREEVEDDPEA